MGMTRDFTWNIQGRPAALDRMASNAAAVEASLGANQYANRMAANAAAAEAPLAAKEYADRMAANAAAAEASLGAKEYADRMAARSMGLQALPDTTFGQAQSALYGKMGDEAVRAAELKELAQLKAEREKRMNDPKLKMAAMLAMAGQPGAIQSILTNDLTKGDTKSQAQTDMDALEEKIVNDMFALAGADKDTYEKLTAGLLPLYRSKWEELAKKGGKSRMGGSDWDSGWGQIIAGLGATRQGKIDKAIRNKKTDKNAALKF